MKLSIITINYNKVNGLNKTIKSVISQTYCDFEWIIIDGGSTDGSKEVIEELAKNPDANISYWCSEPDSGVYNAMNKGIAKARGDYLLFLNSGDSLTDKDVINDFFLWSKYHNEDIITGDLMIDNDSSNIRKAPNVEELDLKYMLTRTLNHPCSFIKRELFEKYGYYDESLRIVSDWKWFLYATIQHNCSYTPWQRIVSNFMTDGMSERPEFLELHMTERKKVSDAFLPRVQSYVSKVTSQEYIIQTYSLKWFVKSKLARKIQNKAISIKSSF